MKIYLDNCCYNRPYDSQSQLRIAMESQAKLKIQNMIMHGEVDLVSSFAVAYEQSKNPYQERRDSIVDFIKQYGNEIVDSDKIEEIEELAQPIIETGIKTLDAYHIACAIYAGCDYMLSVDDRLLKYQNDEIHLMNPIDFIRNWREE